jgi:hypothetical protein
VVPIGKVGQSLKEGSVFLLVVRMVCLHQWQTISILWLDLRIEVLIWQALEQLIDGDPDLVHDHGQLHH